MKHITHSMGFPFRCLVGDATILALGIVCVVTACQPAIAVDGPNVVLIMADDMGYECLGANGCLDYQTPRLDALAACGVRFEHCYAQPLCTPTRVKLMTGISNKRNYVRFGVLDRKQTTFAHILKDAGYRTCVAGKWQLGREPDSAQHFGFDESLLWQHTRGRTDGEGHDTRYPNPRLERNGEPVDYTGGEYSTDRFVDFIGEFMEANRDRPFFVYYPMALVHCPFSPTPDSEAWEPTSRGSSSYKGDPRFFADMVAYTDQAVGRIDAKLGELGLREKTLLVFTADNGTDVPVVTRTTFGRVAGAKGSMTDGGTRVPCIVSWPGVVRSGSVCRDVIDFSDFLPTICQATGTSIPADVNLDGQSFLPQLKGQAGTPRRAIYVWYSRSGKAKEAKVFARNQRYKLYRDGRFFDVGQDYLEKEPLDEAQLTEEVRAIKAMLRSRIDAFEDTDQGG